MKLPIATAAAALTLAMALTACAPTPAEIADNPACKKKWQTVISLARCSFDIQPPPEPVLRTRDTTPSKDAESES